MARQVNKYYQVIYKSKDKFSIVKIFEVINCLYLCSFDLKKRLIPTIIDCLLGLRLSQSNNISNEINQNNNTFSK